MIPLVGWLASRDTLHDRRLVACFVIALAAILAPLVVLLGLKHGVIETLRRELLENPHTRELLPVGNRAFTRDWLDALGARPEVAFQVPRTRSIAAAMYLRRDDGTGLASAELIPTAAGDPLLPGLPSPPRADAVLLSRSAADRLKVGAGDAIRGTLARVIDGRREQANVRLTVAGVAPASAFGRDGAFVRLELMAWVEDFLDGRAPPELDAAPTTDEASRHYASFRLFARTLEDVAPLAAALTAEGLEIRTRADEIATVLNLDRNLSLILMLVGMIGGVGYVASLGANLWANVERKQRDLSVMKLLGFPDRALLCFPLIQAVLIALAGVALAAALTALCSFAINRLPFAHAGETGAVCRVTLVHLAGVTGMTLTGAIAAAALAAWRVTRIAPSDGLRDV